MRISATNFNGKDVRLSLSAESAAEQAQLRELVVALTDAKARWLPWTSDDGKGITLVVERRDGAWQTDNGAPRPDPASDGNG